MKHRPDERGPPAHSRGRAREPFERRGIKEDGDGDCLAEEVVIAAALRRCVSTYAPQHTNRTMWLDDAASCERRQPALHAMHERNLDQLNAIVRTPIYLSMPRNKQIKNLPLLQSYEHLFNAAKQANQKLTSRCCKSWPCSCSDPAAASARRRKAVRPQRHAISDIPGPRVLSLSAKACNPHGSLNPKFLV